MKKIFLFPVLFFAVAVTAQQLPHYSQYMLNDYVMNPAIAGKDNYFTGMSDSRYQWGGITDAPRTYILSVQGPLKFQHMGVGGQLFTDIVGPTRRTGFYLSYAYHVPLGEKMKLGFGVSAGILQFAIDGQKLTLHDPGDVVLLNAVESALLPDFNAGFYLHSDRFWVGASCMQIFQSKIKFFDYMSSTTSVIERHYYGMLGYRQPLGDNFIIEPSALLKYAYPAPFQFDVGARVIYKEKFWFGGSYRNLDAISAYTGFIFRENLVIGYSYDYTTTNLGNYNNGTHEVVIAIHFNKNGVTKPQDSQTKFD